MIKFHLANYINVDELQSLFNLLKNFSGIMVHLVDSQYNCAGDDFSCDFCAKCIKKSLKGRKLCQEYFSAYLKQVTMIKQFAEFRCHVDLIDFVAPIMIQDEIVGFLHAGQIIDKPHDFEKAKQFAKNLDIDENEYLEYYKTVKYFNPDEKSKTVEMLKLLVKYISDRVAGVYESSMQQKVVELTGFVFDNVNNSSMQQAEILQILSREISSMLSIPSIKIFSFYKKTKSFKTISSFKVNNNVPDLTISYDNKEYMEKIMDFWCNNFQYEAQDGNVVVYDMMQNEHLPKSLAQMYLNAGIKSLVAMKVYESDDEFFVLALLSNVNLSSKFRRNMHFLNFLAKNISLIIDYSLNVVSVNKEFMEAYKNIRAKYNRAVFPALYRGYRLKKDGIKYKNNVLQCENIDRAWNYIDNFKPKHSQVMHFINNADNISTVLSVTIGKELIKKGYNVRFIPFSNAVKIFNNISSTGDIMMVNDQLKFFRNVDFWIFVGFGRTEISEENIAKSFEFIDMLCQNKSNFILLSDKNQIDRMAASPANKALIERFNSVADEIYFNKPAMVTNKEKEMIAQ